jgi:DnaJ-class molecular chaperone
MKEIVTTLYASFDGRIFLSAEECLDHEATLKNHYVCPVCIGSGKVNGDPVYEPKFSQDLSLLGFHDCYTPQIVGFTKKTCPTCKGLGYTTRQLTPITQTVGWE